MGRANLLYLALLVIATSSFPAAQANDDELFTASGQKVSKLRMPGPSLNEIRAQAKTLNEWIALTDAADAQEAEAASRVVRAIGSGSGLGADECKAIYETAVELSKARQSHKRIAGAALLGRISIEAFERHQDAIDALVPLVKDENAEVQLAAFRALKGIERYKKPSLH